METYTIVKKLIHLLLSKLLRFVLCDQILAIVVLVEMVFVYDIVILLQIEIGLHVISNPMITLTVR